MTQKMDNLSRGLTGKATRTWKVILECESKRYRFKGIFYIDAIYLMVYKKEKL